jgi:aminocarboxymuconate-semialdehyde decarboxylase
LVYDSDNVRFLIEHFGAAKVLMGTDYPFLIREVPAGKVLEEVSGITEEERMMMRGLNASRFLNLKDDASAGTAAV